MITYREAFVTITPESAAYGDSESAGWIDEEAYADFRAMVAMLRGAEPSCYPVDAVEPCHLWYTKYDYDSDIPTGRTENRSYFAADSRAARYMLKAWKMGNCH